MNDARCFELYSVRGMQRKDVAQVMGVSVEEVRRALARHAAAQRKKAAEDRKVLLRESRERRVFNKKFPDAPAEWWPVWLARSMVKP